MGMYGLGWTAPLVSRARSQFLIRGECRSVQVQHPELPERREVFKVSKILPCGREVVCGWGLQERGRHGVITDWQ